MNFEFSFVSCENGILQRRHNYVIITTVVFSHPERHARNCENLPKFVKVMVKILSVLFFGHGVSSGRMYCLITML